MRFTTLLSSVPVVLGLALAATASEPSAVLEDYGGVVTAPAPQPVPTPGPGDASGAPTRARAVAWMKAHQHPDGGWSSGAHGTDGSDAPSDVATTAFTVLALVRDASGSRVHQDAVTRGTLFVVDRIERAPQGPMVDTPRGTQIQHKLGELVDTHLAALLLGEVAGTLDPATNRRVDVALDAVIGKVQLAQRADGSFDANGWAPVLSSSIAAQSLNRAIALGRAVDDKVVARSDAYQAELASPAGGFDASEGAGVELYAVASTLRTNSQAADRGAGVGAKEAQAAAARRVSADSSGQLMAGFGSIGGEEMLSYMMISDSLAEEGGAEWRQWESKVNEYLASIQNTDGSWVGHHCITSRAFTTAGAVMTLASGDWEDYTDRRPTRG